MVTTVEKWTCRWSWEMNGDPRQLATVTHRWINHYAAWLCTNNHATASCPTRIFHFASGLVPSIKPASSQLIVPLDLKKCYQFYFPKIKTHSPVREPTLWPFCNCLHQDEVETKHLTGQSSGLALDFLCVLCDCVSGYWTDTVGHGLYPALHLFHWGLL